MITPQRVNEARAVAIWIVRGAAAILMAVGCYLVLKRLLFALLATGDVTSAWILYEGTGESHSLYRGVAMYVVGLFLAIVSGRLVRWAIVTPAEGCPGCGYAVSGERNQMQRCPECGLAGVAPREQREQE